MREMAGARRETGTIVVILADLLVPHIHCLLRRQRPTGVEGQVLAELLLSAVLQSASFGQVLCPLLRSACGLGVPRQRRRAMFLSVPIVLKYHVPSELIRPWMQGEESVARQV